MSTLACQPNHVQGSQVLTFQNARAIQVVDPDIQSSQVLERPKDIYVQRILQAVDGERLHCGEIAKAPLLHPSIVTSSAESAHTLSVNKANPSDYLAERGVPR